MRAKWGYRTVGTINLAGMEAPEPLDCKSPSQVRPERGCISRETADLLRNPARNGA